MGDGWVSHVVPCSRYKAGPFPFFFVIHTCSRFVFLFMFLRSSGMVKSEPMDVAFEGAAAAPPAKRPRGRPRKDGTASGRGKAAAADAAGSSAGRGKGGDRSSSKKIGTAGGGVAGGGGRGKHLILLHDSASEKEAIPVLPPPGFDPIPKYASAAAGGGKDRAELSSASTDSLENPWRL